MKRLVIVGAGGCAREVEWTVRESSLEFEPIGFVVSDRACVGTHDSTQRILGDFDWLETHCDEVDAVVMGIGNPSVRTRLADEMEKRFPTLVWPSFLHPRAIVDRSSVSIGSGVVVCANTVITVNVTLAAHVLVHYGCTVSHEAKIGRASVLNPSCSISGGVTVGRAALIGAGARVLQCRRIGDFATVGAGAIVTRDVLPEEVVKGIPARG